MYEGPTSLISQDIGLLGGVPLKPLATDSKLAVSGKPERPGGTRQLLAERHPVLPAAVR
jgi:hypothetical protein